MLTPKQIRMLQLLDEQIQACEKCELYKNGRAKPYHTKYTKYAIIGEAPGKDEVTKNTPFIGKAGDKLWEIMSEFSLRRSDFLIINSVNCRPVTSNRNGKPTSEQMSTCKQWIHKYLKVVNPQKLLLLGNYALTTMLSESESVKRNGEIERLDEYNVNVYKSVHPAYVIYNKEKGEELLKYAIKKFYEDIPI